MSRIYLDHAATSPLRPEAHAAMERGWLYGNSASPHAEGRQARFALNEARAQVASLVGARPEEVFFTSGATEATNLAVRGRARRPDSSHVVSTRLEHSATLKTCEALAHEGWSVSLLPNDTSGRVSPEELRRVLQPGTALVSIIAGHNELGVVQDLEALAQEAHAAGSLLHLDAVQAAGYLDLGAVQWDMLSLSAHKLGGPQGIGALVVRGSPLLRPLLMGGAQERGLRPGTVPVALACGFGAAAEASRARRSEEAMRLEGLRDWLGSSLMERLPMLRPLGVWSESPDAALPHILAFALSGVRGDELVLALDDAGIACSSSAACLTGARSHVLEALGLSEDLHMIRFSLGWNTTREEVGLAARCIEEAWTRLKALSPFERRRPLIASRAKETGLLLQSSHWTALEAVFDFHHTHGVLPGPRHLGKVLSASLRLEDLFPRGLATIASWLDIPVPQGGCRPYAG